jgi:type II secretory ATPase GspE/PulE/Tfp pilus assembly ATPase PilB-like protein
VVPLGPESIDLLAFKEYRDLCLANRFLPTFQHQIVLCIASPEPFNQEILREIRRSTQKEIRIIGCTEQDFDRTYPAVEEALAAILADEAADNPAPIVSPALTWEVDTRDMTNTVRGIVENAFRTGANDIQIEPAETQVNIRFLYANWEPMPPIEAQHGKALVKAFKTLAGLSDLGSKAFMSGKISFDFGIGPHRRRIDLRIEISPSTNGDGVSARILERDKFEAMRPPLPFEGSELQLVMHSLNQAQGLIVFVGPTGSGKSTLMTKIIRHINAVDRNIRTIEDPPEYTLSNIWQIEVGENVNRTFEEGLYSLMRQKPDIIIVGEIRSNEVATTAVKAGLSGHLVLATMHAEDAPSAVNVLLNKEVGAHDLQATLHLIVGQRLVSCLCENCKRPEAPSAEAAAHFEMYGIPIPKEIFQPVGCHRCSNRGKKGKMPIYEVFAPSVEVRELIEPNVKDSVLRKAWLEQGGRTMIEYGLIQVAGGRIAWEDIRRYERTRIVAAAPAR